MGLLKARKIGIVLESNFNLPGSNFLAPPGAYILCRNSHGMHAATTWRMPPSPAHRVSWRLGATWVPNPAWGRRPSYMAVCVIVRPEELHDATQAIRVGNEKKPTTQPKSSSYVGNCSHDTWRSKLKQETQHN
jgi:hypothetical protein